MFRYLILVSTNLFVYLWYLPLHTHIWFLCMYPYSFWTKDLILMIFFIIIGKGCFVLLVMVSCKFHHHQNIVHLSAGLIFLNCCCCCFVFSSWKGSSSIHKSWQLALITKFECYVQIHRTPLCFKNSYCIICSFCVYIQKFIRNINQLPVNMKDIGVIKNECGPNDGVSKKFVLPNLSR